MTDFKDFLAEQLQDPEILAEYQALEPEYKRIQAMYKLQYRQCTSYRSNWNGAFRVRRKKDGFLQTKWKEPSWNLRCRRL